MEGQLTAFFLIGEPEQFYGKINEVFLLNLYENSKPMYVLRPQNSEWKEIDIAFIPTVEFMLDDAFVILSAYYLQDQSIKDVFNSYCNNEQEDKPLNFNEIPLEKRLILYNMTHELNWQNTKITLTMFAQSSLKQLINYEHYRDILEVFQPKLT